LLVRPRWIYILAICTFAILVRTTPSAASALIDPELTSFRPQSQGSPATESTEEARSPIPVAISSESGRWYADVWVKGDVDPLAIARIGGQVHTIAGDVMTVRLPIDAVSELGKLPKLERVQLAQRMTFQSDIVIRETGVTTLWGGSAPNFSANGITGKGVVVGIVDTGIDPTHPDFKTPSGTRIKWLWDQSVVVGATPPGFSYGQEYSASAINAGSCPSIDTDGHGTHLAGVAAGNGRATGNGEPAYQFLGVAPEADLVVVKLRTLVDGSVTDDKVADGVRYVFERAAALGKPAVVVLAVTKMTGPHDGQDPLDLAISNLTAPGKIVCAAVGNYGGKSSHAEWTATGANQSGDITLSVPTYFPGPTGTEYFTAEGWHGGAGQFSVTLITPTGERVGPVAHGQELLAYTGSGAVQIRNSIYESANGSHRIILHVFRGNATRPQVAAGTWTYHFTSNAPGTHRVDAWFTGYALGSGSPKFESGKSARCLIGSPATANGVIAVGAYSTKRYWTAIDGRSYFLPNAHVDDIDDTSAPGPRRDGVRLPHVAAPGLSVANARSLQSFPSTMYLMPDGVHVIRYGTSVAAAGAAGTVALLLQTNPTATPEQATNMVKNAAADSYTGAVPNDVWGWGKLRAPVAVAGVVPDGNPRVGFALGSQNPARGSMSFEFSLAAADLPGRLQISILDGSGRESAELHVEPRLGPQRTTWDGRTVSGKAPAGMYWARLKTAQGVSTRTFVMLR